MIDNKTSQAVEEMQKGSISVLAGRPTRVAIAEKFKKMEAALREIIFYEKEIYDYEPLDAKAADELVKIAEEAFDFDPLSHQRRAI